jgi:hypothetical protein
MAISVDLDLLRKENAPLEPATKGDLALMHTSEMRSQV